MKNFLTIALSSVLFVACNNNGGIGMGGGGWSNSEKSGFMKQCTQSAAGIGEEKAKQYCSCTMEKIQKKYPKYSDANAASNDEITAIGRSCLNGMNGENNGNDFENNNGDDFNMNNGKKKKNDDDYNDDGGYNNGGNNGWSNADEQRFMNTCLQNAMNAGADRERSNTHCNCVLQKLEKKYKSYADADKNGSKTEMNAIEQQCVQENGMGNDDNDNNNY